ncbi:MAG TPA: entericidin A/B family lipoprotein [Casimicrobiaceae bacterium]|nr:entericidin A/B family lipoprotein [Casimicrobiaceae bacterium]
MIEKIVVPLLAAMFVVGFSGALAGCNTMAGAGKDIQQGGQSIQNEANEHKSNN